MKVKSIGKFIAEGLINGALGSIGAGILSSVFGPGQPDFFVDYDKIQDIVKTEIIANEIDKLNGNIQGVGMWVKNVYLEQKESGVSKESLYDILQPQESYLAIEVLAVLQSKPYAEPGFGAFLIGAGVHLTLLQELSLVDPNAATPEESGYTKSLQAYANDYYQFGIATWGSITTKRLDYITPLNRHDDYITTPLFQAYIGVTYSYDDKYTGYHYSNSGFILIGEPKKYRNYKDSKVNELVTELNDPRAIMDLWSQLEEKPFPQSWRTSIRSYCKTSIKNLEAAEYISVTEHFKEVDSIRGAAANGFKKLEVILEKNKLRAQNISLLEVWDHRAGSKITCCIQVPQGLLSEMKKNRLFQTYTIPGGLYATFVHKGARENIRSTLVMAARNLLNSTFVVRKDAVHFFKYNNDATHTKTEDLRTEIYVPIMDVTSRL